MTLISAPLPPHALRCTASAIATAAAAACCLAAPSASWATSADVAEQQLAVALGDLGLALLRDSPGANAVVSPLAVATVLGMVQSGATGNTEHEIEALFGPGRSGAMAMRHSLPALSAQLREATGGKARPAAAARAAGSAGSAHSAHAMHMASASASAPTAQPAASAASGPAVRQAARVWIDSSVAKDTPASFKHRLAARHGADALVLSFADTEAARAQINRWTAEHTAGRIAELLPAGSLAKSTQLTLTAAVHFRSAWAKPFDAAQTEPRPFIGVVPVSATGAASGAAGAAGTPTVPTLRDERPLAQAVVDGHRLYALPFAAGYDLVLGVPAEAGRRRRRWRLASKRCSRASTARRWRAGERH
ncbi:MAG: serpin family protein [Rubrivivax sp.]